MAYPEVLFPAVTCIKPLRTAVTDMARGPGIFACSGSR